MTERIQTSQHRIQQRGFWWVTGAAVLWGTIGVVTQAIFNIDSSSSLFINLGRLAIAAPVLAFVCWHVMGRRMFHVARRDLFLMLLNGSLLALSQAAYFAAIREVGVTFSTLITICISPLIVTALSVLFGREILSGRIIVALLLALIGSALLVGFQAPTGGRESWLLGLAFALAAAVVYALALQCGRFLARDYHPLQVMTVTFGAGTGVLLVVNLISGVAILHTTQGWLLLAYLGLVPTALAYWLFQTGLRSVSATSASIISMLDPLVAAILAWALFGETLAPAGLLGAALLLGSMGLLMTEKTEPAVV